MLSIKRLTHLVNLRNVYLYTEKLTSDNIRQHEANLITFSSKFINSSVYSYKSMDSFVCMDICPPVFLSFS